MFFKCVVKSQPLQYQLQIKERGGEKTKTKKNTKENNSPPKKKESHNILPLKFFLKVPTYICMFGLYLSADEVYMCGHSFKVFRFCQNDSTLLPRDLNIMGPAAEGDVFCEQIFYSSHIFTNV